MSAPRSLSTTVVVLVAILVAACESREEPLPPPTPSPTVAAEVHDLTARDVQVYVAVKARALQYVEEELDRLTAGSADLPGEIEDLSTAERSAADALGVGWRRYTWIRDEIAGLLGDQRQREDARILMLELTRTRDDLKEQLAQVRDEASRQFLAAQLNSLDEKLAALDAERRVPQDEERELAVIEEARAELATLQGRQDRLQRSVRDLLQAARSRRATGATPPPARGTGVGRRGSGTVPPAR